MTREYQYSLFSDIYGLSSYSKEPEIKVILGKRALQTCDHLISVFIALHVHSAQLPGNRHCIVLLMSPSSN